MSGRGGGSSQAISNANDKPKKKINIHMKSQDGNTLIFNIPRKLKLSVLFHDYCIRKQFDFQTARFFHEGLRVQGKYTAAKLNLEDEAEIYCMFHQAGGGFYIMPKTT